MYFSNINFRVIFVFLFLGQLQLGTSKHKEEIKALLEETKCADLILHRSPDIKFFDLKEANCVNKEAKISCDVSSSSSKGDYWCCSSNKPDKLPRSNWKHGKCRSMVDIIENEKLIWENDAHEIEISVEFYAPITWKYYFIEKLYNDDPIEEGSAEFELLQTIMNETNSESAVQFYKTIENNLEDIDNAEVREGVIKAYKLLQSKFFLFYIFF